MSLAQTIDRKLTAAFACHTVALLAWFPAAFLLPNTPATGCVLVGLGLAWFASRRQMIRIKRAAGYLLEVMERITDFPCEAGERIGMYQGASIFEWVKINDAGPRYYYAGPARIHPLADDEVFVWPGLFYRMVA